VDCNVFLNGWELQWYYKKHCRGMDNPNTFVMIERAP